MHQQSMLHAPTFPHKAGCVSCLVPADLSSAHIALRLTSHRDGHLYMCMHHQSHELTACTLAVCATVQHVIDTRASPEPKQHIIDTCAIPIHATLQHTWQACWLCVTYLMLYAYLCHLPAQIIHEFVEVLDKYFGNVCELDVIFNFHKAYYILDELLIAGAAHVWDVVVGNL